MTFLETRNLLCSSSLLLIEILPVCVAIYLYAHIAHCPNSSAKGVNKSQVNILVDFSKLDVYLISDLVFVFHFDTIFEFALQFSVGRHSIHISTHCWLETVKESSKNQNFPFDLQIPPTLLNGTYSQCQMTGFITTRVQNF